MAVKTFQRDTLVALQDAVVDLGEFAFSFEGAESEAVRLKYDAAVTHLQMLASRVRDEQLRKAVDAYLKGLDELVDIAIVKAINIELDDPHDGVPIRSIYLLRRR